jgi:phosphatidylglycerophosphate synthase
MDNDKPWDASLAYNLIYLLRNSWVAPDHLTFLRLIFGIIAAIAFGQGNYYMANIGAFCFVISNFLDHADGELARLTGKITPHGHYFDLASDAIVNTTLFIGIGVGLMNTNLGLWSLPMGIIAGLSVAAIFHMRNQIELGIGKAEARQPHLAKFEAEDILYLLPIVTIMDWLGPFLLLASIGTPVFALWVLSEYHALKNENISHRR